MTNRKSELTVAADDSGPSGPMPTGAHSQSLADLVTPCNWSDLISNIAEKRPREQSILAGNVFRLCQQWHRDVDKATGGGRLRAAIREAIASENKDIACAHRWSCQLKTWATRMSDAASAYQWYRDTGADMLKAAYRNDLQQLDTESARGIADSKRLRERLKDCVAALASSRVFALRRTRGLHDRAQSLETLARIYDDCIDDRSAASILEALPDTLQSVFQ